MSPTIGQHEHKLDSKNRLAIPPKYREALIADPKGSHFTLALGVNDCITLFLPSQWEEFHKTVTDATQAFKNKERARWVKRQIFQTAAEAPLDSQGRILIPHVLKTHAKLKKDVMITGAGDKAEIWDMAIWRKNTQTKAVPAFNQLAKQLDF